MPLHSKAAILSSYRYTCTNIKWHTYKAVYQSTVFNCRRRNFGAQQRYICIFWIFWNFSWYTVLGVDPTLIFPQLEPVVICHLLKSSCLVKKSMIYPYSKILQSNKKKDTPTIWNKAESVRYCAESKAADQ